MKNLSPILKKLFIVLIFAIVSIIFIERYLLGNFIQYGEEQGFLNYDFVNYRYLSLWAGTMNFGGNSANILNIIPLGFIWHFFKIFHISLPITERLFFFIVIFTTSIFSYYFFQSQCKNRLISFLLTLIYISTYNFFNSVTTSPKLLHFLILPAALLCSVKYLATSKLKYLILNIVVIIATLSIGINPPQMLGAYSLIILFVLLTSIQDNKIVNGLIFLFPYFLNIIFIFLLNILVVRSEQLGLATKDFFQLDFSATNSFVHRILRFFGAWWDLSGNAGEPYNHLLPYHNSRIGIIISYLRIFLLLFLAIISKSKRKIIVIMLFIIFIFATKGSTEPFKFVFDFFYSFPVFRIFREPWAKFMPSFIFVVLLGISQLSSDIKKKYVLLIVIATLFIISTYQIIPLLSKKVVDHRNLTWKLLDVKIPDYWENIYKWSDTSARNKRVLILPASLEHGKRLLYDWKPFRFSGNPEYYFIYSNIIYNNYVKTERDIVYQFYENLNPQFLSLASIDYVINQRDLITNKTKVAKIEDVSSGLDAKNKIKFGLIDVYPVSTIFKTNKIRSITNIYPIDNNCDLSNLPKNIDFGTSSVVNTNHQFQVPKLSSANIKINSINNTIYSVNINKIDGDVIGILLAENYNRGWKIYNSNSIFAKEIVPEKYHLTGNCFQNLWLIPRNLLDNNSSIFIKYQPEIFFNIIIYFYFFLIIIFICFVYIKKSIFNKKT